VNKQSKSSIKKMICFVSSMDAGGAETFIMKLYKSIDRDKYQFDFLVSSKAEGFYDKEIRIMGGCIYYTPPKSRHLFKNLLTSFRIIKNGNYDAALRIASHSLGTIDLLVAKIAGVKKTVLRSSNAGSTGGGIGYLMHRVFFFLPKYVPNIKFAPSVLAAEYLFGKSCVHCGDVEILKNSISLDKYKFSSNSRNIKRCELRIESNFVIGHVGRFNLQKNHEFLIKVFYEVCQYLTEAKLLLIGKGELEREIRKQVIKLGLADRVIFAGERDDVPKLLMAMDVMLFPSFFEGMPNVVIEAQATGLPCIISDAITSEAILSNLVVSLPIKNDLNTIKKWTKHLLEMKDSRSNRSDGIKVLKDAGYDIKETSEYFTRKIFDDN